MRFTKAHGLGNDFIIIDGRSFAPSEGYGTLSVTLCDRHTGIGADGLLIVCESDVCDCRMRIFNSDGSEAEMCGNGIRCFAKYVYERGIVPRDTFTVETLAGVITPALMVTDGVVERVRVDMGKPGLLAQDVPVLCDTPNFIGKDVTVLGRDFTLTSVRMGVPHTTAFVDDPATFEREVYGPAIEHLAIFPERTNVNFVRVVDAHNIIMRTWERGCGCTLACGTGACGAVVACVLNGKTERTANVHIALGVIEVDWTTDGNVFMTGPAALVFDGEC